MIRWNSIKGAAVICAAIGWWSIWFPELAVWSEGVRPVPQETEAGTEESVQEEWGESEKICSSRAREIYRGLLQADREQIQVKSRIYELIRQYLGEEEDREK